jgi:uncharacterized protein YggE
MPVKKIKKPANEDLVLNKHHRSVFAEFTSKIIITLIVIVLVYTAIFLATLIRNNIKEFYYIGKADKFERNINLDAEGKVSVLPDVAIITIGMEAIGDTVKDAQNENSRIINNILSKLDDYGVKKEDIQTINYNVNPRYNYTEEEGRVLEGYEVTEELKIKIRDISKSGNIVAIAGESGANIVSNLSFEVEDMEKYKKQAREEAMKKILVKAKDLHEKLGIEFVSVASYNEYENQSVMSFPAFETRMLGIGGPAPVPKIESGTQDLILNVNISFEIK